VPGIGSLLIVNFSMINNAENVILTKEVAEELDLNDPLAGLRDFFFFQGEKLYFDGNSL